MNMFPRKDIAPTTPEPTEQNVLVYFDRREMHPFMVNLDKDKSQVELPFGRINSHMNWQFSLVDLCSSAVSEFNLH